MLQDPAAAARGPFAGGGSIVTDDRVALLEWAAKSDEMEITDGVDSFLIEDGLIMVQTIRYTVTYSDLSQAQRAGGD